MVAVLEGKAAEAWHHIQEPKEVLSMYIRQQHIDLNDDEASIVLSKLQTENYDYSENSFRTSVKSICKELDYAKKVKNTRSLWLSVSTYNTVSEWCNSNGLPIVWLLLPEQIDMINTLRQLDNNERVDQARIENACLLLSQGDFSILSDKKAVYECLIKNIASNEYYDLLSSKTYDLVEYLKKSVSIDVYLWSNMHIQLRNATQKYVKTFLKDEVVDKAKRKVASFTETEIRSRLNKLLEESPDICLMILRD